MTYDELKKELDRRKELLISLWKKKIFSFEKVQKIINDYYKDPDKVLQEYIE